MICDGCGEPVRPGEEHLHLRCHLIDADPDHDSGDYDRAADSWEDAYWEQFGPTY